MVQTIKDRTAIVGIGQTAFAKGLEDSELSLACQAISAAIDDAGLRPPDVDGLAMFSMENGREVEVARNVGLGDVTYFSARSATAAAPAAPPSATPRWRSPPGSARWRWPGGRASARPRRSRPWAQVEPAPRAARTQWTRPFGLLRPVDEIAMLARRYMHEFGATRDHLANVALAFRKHANRNPARDDVREGADARAVHGRRAGSPSPCACSTTAWRPTARWRW